MPPEFYQRGAVRVRPVSLDLDDQLFTNLAGTQPLAQHLGLDSQPLAAQTESARERPPARSGT
jgi:hypothetical protein